MVPLLPHQGNNGAVEAAPSAAGSFQRCLQGEQGGTLGWHRDPPVLSQTSEPPRGFVVLCIT